MLTSYPQPRSSRSNLRYVKIANTNLDSINSEPSQDLQSLVDRLVQGNREFVKLHNRNIQSNSICLSAVAQGNTPFAAVLNYTNPATSIENIFGQKFGELFVINSQNDCPNSREISGIEYGVLMLGVKVIVVLGDEFYRHEHPKYFKLTVRHNKILISDRSKSAAKTQLLDRIAKLQDSPLLCKFIQAGNLQIVGGLYDATRGTVKIIRG